MTDWKVNFFELFAFPPTPTEKLDAPPEEPVLTDIPALVLPLVDADV